MKFLELAQPSFKLTKLTADKIRSSHIQQSTKLTTPGTNELLTKVAANKAAFSYI